MVYFIPVMDKKLLIFIVAYNAEKTIESVLLRIPLDKLPKNTEVLVIDDSSKDATFRKAKENSSKFSGLKFTVLYNPVNQGYGGNQKLGYQYAIEHGYDVVALVHGDGQYAPERLPELIKPVCDGDADACFGSRMMVPWSALKSGMPLYKYFGNKTLTFIQNKLLQTNMTEFHSGYRVYSVKALEKIPFRLNTNDFHFDTEIIIQFLIARLRIKEAAIPTYYGDEICYVNGMKYAWDVFKATISSRLHLLGIFFQNKYDIRDRKDVYDLKVGYPSSHAYAMDAVQKGASVLDLACGPGYVSKELRKNGCVVTGVDKAPADESNFNRFIQHDLDKCDLPSDVGYYDYVLLLDALEHLDEPERFLAMVRERLFTDKVKMIISVPNIGFFMNRLGLLFGQFNYGAAGILDRTHRRLFTFRTLKTMLQQEGFIIKRIQGIPAPFPKAFGDNWFSQTMLFINMCFIMIWKGMFSYQIFVEAGINPTVKHLLSRTIEFSGKLSDTDSSKRIEY